MYSEPTTPTPTSPVPTAETAPKETNTLIPSFTYESMDKAPVSEELIFNLYQRTDRVTFERANEVIDARFKRLEDNLTHIVAEGIKPIRVSINKECESLRRTIEFLNENHEHLKESGKEQDEMLATFRESAKKFSAAAEAYRVSVIEAQAKQQLTDARNKISFNETSLEFDKALEAIQEFVSRDKNAADSKWLVCSSETGKVTHLNRWFFGPRPLSEALLESHPNGCTLNELYKFLLRWNILVDDPEILDNAVFKVLGLEEPAP